MEKNSSKSLGLWALTALVCGNMIGSGIFLLPSGLARIGTISLWSWGITVLGAVSLAWMFFHLSLFLPKAGGPYAYTRAALGDFLGFQTAYSYWVAIWVGNAAMVLAGIGYLAIFFPLFTHPVARCVAAISILGLFTCLNAWGVGFIGRIQCVVTCLKLVPLLLLGIGGWFWVHPEYFSHDVVVRHQSHFSAIMQGTTLTLWSFIGLESATIPADSVKNPKKNIPLATMLGTLIAAFVYVSSSTCIMGMIPSLQLQKSTAPFAEAARMMVGIFGEYIVTIGAIIACFGALNGWVLLQGQMAMAAARDQLFPQIFARCNRHQVPVAGLVIGSLLTIALLLLTMSDSLVVQFQTIILVAVLASVIPYFYTSVAQWLLLKKKSFVWIVVAFLATAYTVFLLWSMDGQTWFIGCGLLLSSVPCYVWIRYGSRRRS